MAKPPKKKNSISRFLKGNDATLPLFGKEALDANIKISGQVRVHPKQIDPGRALFRIRLMGGAIDPITLGQAITDVGYRRLACDVTASILSSAANGAPLYRTAFCDAEIIDDGDYLTVTIPRTIVKFYEDVFRNTLSGAIIDDKTQGEIHGNVLNMVVDQELCRGNNQFYAITAIATLIVRLLRLKQVSTFTVCDIDHDMTFFAGRVYKSLQGHAFEALSEESDLDRINNGYVTKGREQRTYIWQRDRKSDTVLEFLTLLRNRFLNRGSDKERVELQQRIERNKLAEELAKSKGRDKSVSVDKPSDEAASRKRPMTFSTLRQMNSRYS